ncbi:hypothetical protein [Caballeronia pedi]|nr:hypothetical protein [Caballeronia pedi]
MTYTAQKLNIAGQPQAYRVTCSSLLGSQKSCMSAASRICKDQQVVAVQAFDSNKSAFDFTCAGGPPAKPAA